MRTKKRDSAAMRAIAPAVLAVELLVLGGACVSAPPPPPDVVYVETAPPALRSEVIVTAPGPGYVWVPGSWTWGGAEYTWTGGSWQQPPRADAHWVAPAWNRTSRGWYRVDGHWR
jgi:hypothetical protein